MWICWETSLRLLVQGIWDRGGVGHSAIPRKLRGSISNRTKNEHRAVEARVSILSSPRKPRGSKSGTHASACGPYIYIYIYIYRRVRTYSRSEHTAGGGIFWAGADFGCGGPISHGYDHETMQEHARVLGYFAFGKLPGPRKEHNCIFTFFVKTKPKWRLRPAR